MPSQAQVSVAVVEAPTAAAAAAAAAWQQNESVVAGNKLHEVDHFAKIKKKSLKKMTRKDYSQVDLKDRPAPHPRRRQAAAACLISDLVCSM